MTPMNCATLRDRIPDVASGRAKWSPEEEAHLDGCPECREEWALVRAAARVGTEVEREFDPSRIAGAVVARWREAPRPAVRPIRRAALVGLATAAAALLVLLPRGPAPATAESPLILTELDSLSTDELVLVADQLDLPLTELELFEEAPLSDLDTIQLGRILRSLEG